MMFLRHKVRWQRYRWGIGGGPCFEEEEEEQEQEEEEEEEEGICLNILLQPISHYTWKLKSEIQCRVSRNTWGVVMHWQV